MINEYEKVHTMTDYYDGPRGGVADFNGSPVVYQSEFLDIGHKDEDTFLIQSISPKAFAHAIEDWEIWLRWERAYQQGETDLKTHPALPEDRQRHEELQLISMAELKIENSTATRAKANFNMFNNQLMVKWKSTIDQDE